MGPASDLHCTMKGDYTHKLLGGPLICCYRCAHWRMAPGYWGSVAKGTVPQLPRGQTWFEGKSQLVIRNTREATGSKAGQLAREGVSCCFLKRY